VDEAVESGCSELKRLSNVRRIASHEGCSAKSVHPFRQIVEVLTVAIPFQSLVYWFIRLALLARLADPQTAFGRMTLP
jgi:hypothetical protein